MLTLLGGCEYLAKIPSLLGGGEQYLLHGYDVLCYPGQSIELTARLQGGYRLADIRGQEIVFCHDQREIGRAVTDSEGYASIRWQAPSNIGYWFVVCQPAAPEVAAGAGKARLLVDAVSADTPIVIVDMDNTVVRPQWTGVVTGTADPVPDSAEVLRRLHEDCGWAVVYLSARPDLLGVRSRDWLDKHQFPLGPLLLSQRLLIYDSGQQDYKSRRLMQVAARFRNIRAAIGDKPGDALAYGAINIPMCIVVLSNTVADRDGRRIRELADGDGAIRIARDWRQVEDLLHGQCEASDTRHQASQRGIMLQPQKINHEAHQVH